MNPYTSAHRIAETVELHGKASKKPATQAHRHLLEKAGDSPKGSVLQTLCGMQSTQGRGWLAGWQETT